MKPKLWIFTYLFLSFFAQASLAQFPSEGDYQSINPPATPNVPAYLESVTDESVPTHINLKRIAQPIPNYWEYPTHEYAKIQPWNADETKYKLYSVAIYDATTHEEVGSLPGGDLYPTYWSNTDADRLWGFRENGDIKSYKVSTNEITTHGHIYFDSNANTDYDLLKLGPGEGNIDINDKYVAFVGKKGSDMDIIVYDLTTFSIVQKKTLAGAWGNTVDYPEYVDWVSVSQSGNLVGIMWDTDVTSSNNPFVENGTNHFGIEIYDTDMVFLRRIADYGNHGDFGYAQNGKEVFVQSWGTTGTLNMYYLDGSGRIVLSNSQDFSGEGHVSCRNLNRPGWAYVSQDDDTKQIVAFKLDEDTNTEIVEHYGHHFSTSISYLKSPMPVPTPNGEKIMFKSDFGDNTADVIYLFEATVAAPLAVEWTTPLVAYKQNNDILLTWTVAQQINNEKFEIERSADGIHFKTLGSIKADGNLAARKEFKALDSQPIMGHNYYRIKQIDYDGKFDYSNISSVYFDRDEISIYPNPAHDEIHITSKKDVLRQIDIYNHIGQLVQSLAQKSNVVNIESLPHGVYWVRITEDVQTSTIKLVKE